MTEKPKIHVFLGAPLDLSLEPQAGSNEDSGQWTTVNCYWDHGRLRPMKDDIGVQVNAECDGEGRSSGNHDEQIHKTVGELEQETFESSCSTKVQDEDELHPGSVKVYLDSCFSTTQQNTQQTESPPRSGLSVETEYLSAWTVSQALLLRGGMGMNTHQTTPRQTPSITSSSPELYSPICSPREGDLGVGGTLVGSLDRLCATPSQRWQEGLVILESTPDGLLLSQERPAARTEQDVQTSPPCLSPPAQPSPDPPARKKSKLVQTPPKYKRTSSDFTSADPPTLLARCTKHGVRYSILVALVHPCHLKEITVKSGASAGSTVALASVVVTDQSNVEIKVVLWRTAAFWALTVFPGDVLFITGLTVHEDKWRGETVLQSSYTSKLLNMGQVANGCSPAECHIGNSWNLEELSGHLRKKRPLLLSLPHHRPQDLNAIPYAHLRALRPGTLVHTLLIVTHINMVAAWRDEAQGISRSSSIGKAVLTVHQGGVQQGAVVLWGAALGWLKRIQRHKDAVWDFQKLLVKKDVTSGLLELHSTPWSSCEPLFPDDSRCREFFIGVDKAQTTSCLEIDIRTLLSQKYTGDVELKVQIRAFQFQGNPSQRALLLMDGDTPFARILDVVSGDITYNGCGRCMVELDTDDNGIYRPCYPCLPHTGVRRYYRPVVLGVKDGESQVCVQVPPTLVQKVLLNTPPDKLSKPVAPSSDVRHVRVVADRIHSLLGVPRASFLLTVRSHFQCDENSVPLIQDFLLLDFKQAL